MTVRSQHRLLSGLTIAMLLGWAQPIAAQPKSAQPKSAQPAGPGLFDKPASVRKVPPGKNASNEVRCTYYADFMVRELMDGPSSEDAAIIRSANPSCSASKAAGEVALKTFGMSLDGRKGNALFFSQIDAHGAVDFVVLDAQSGRSLLSDAAMPSKQLYKSIAIEAGGVRLSYQRGINASCSIAKDAAGCLATLTKEGKLAPVAAGEAPSPAICSAAYKKAKAPADAPSILFYPTDMLIATDGTTKVLSRGPFGCDAQP